MNDAIRDAWLKHAPRERWLSHAPWSTAIHTCLAGNDYPDIDALRKVNRGHPGCAACADNWDCVEEELHGPGGW